MDIAEQCQEIDIAPLHDYCLFNKFFLNTLEII